MAKTLSPFDQKVSNFGHWLIKWRWLVLIFTIMAAVGIGSGGKNLVFTNDYRVWFSPENPQLKAFELMQDTYARNDNVYIMLMPKSGNAFDKNTLNAVLDLTEKGWQIPFSSRVDSVTNYQYTYAEDDDMIVEDLVYTTDGLTDEDFERIKTIATNEVLLKHRLVSESGHVVAVNITVQMPGADTTKEVPIIVDASRKILAEMREKYPDIAFIDTGVMMMNAAFPEASFADMATLVPAMYLAILVGVLLFTRSISATFATLIVIVFSIMVAMGSAGFAGVRLTPPSATAPLLIMTLAVADCVHFLITMLHNMRKGMAKNDAIVESLRINFMPIFLTSITTAIGFLSMNFSDAPPFRDLGNITAIGVLAAFVFSVVLLPVLTSILPIKQKRQPAGTVQVMDKVANFVIAKRTPLLIVFSVLIVFLTFNVTKNELNDQFVEYFDETIEFRTNTDLVSEHLSGLYFIDYSLDTKEAGGISEPTYQRNLESFADWLRNQPEVVHVNTYTEVMKRLNKNMHGDDPAFHKIPNQRDLAAQYLLLYEMSLPYGLDLNNQINVKKSATRMSVTLKTVTSNEIIQLDVNAQNWLAQNAPNITASAASPGLMFSHIGKRNIDSMLIGTTLAIFLISALLIFALGSKKYGFISLIPNLVPALMAFGLWGLFVGQVGLAVSVVASMTLGIVVDDTIHFLSKFLRAKREQNLSTEDAIRYAFHTVGMALTVTTIVLGVGFMILAQSPFSLNADMGILTATTIVIALIIDFFFLPPLIMLLDKKSKQ